MHQSVSQYYKIKRVNEIQKKDLIMQMSVEKIQISTSEFAVMFWVYKTQFQNI